MVQAGIRRKDAVILLNAAHVVIAILLLALCVSKGYLYRQPMLCIVLSIFGGAAIPDIWLKRRIDRRMENIQHALPDAMDLAVVSVEAGLGLDQALMRVGQEIRMAHPDLADELQLRNLEVNMGRNRSDAFLATSTGIRFSPIFRLLSRRLRLNAEPQAAGQISSTALGINPQRKSRS